MEQDWVMGLIGGLLIGCAASLYLLLNGRIMGASGILGGLVDGSAGSQKIERIAFVAGLVLVPTIFATLFFEAETNLTSNLAVIIVAGLLVGAGTRLANGCTSGHGVCGISRLSLRGIVATLMYLLAGVITVAVFRTLIGVI